MGRAIVPLTALVLVFLAFVIWRVQVGRTQRRRDRIEEQKIRDRWASRLMGEETEE